MIFTAPGMKGREKINRETRTKNNDDKQTKKEKEESLMGLRMLF